MSQLAEGGMGVVFVAQHMTTEERVALKVLAPHLVRVDGARKKFELEAKIWARTRNEHIVRMLDAGIDGETGSPFLVMELLEGQTLAARVDQSGPVSWFETVELMTQLARGLDAAHRYENADGVREPIVHRDLKPENIFLAARGDGAALLKILDFGIAKVMRESTALSRDVRGTPLFMAFEQLVGDEPSPRTDVWALGLITHYALTGHHYWRSGAASHREVQALFAEILQLPLPLPSARVREDGLDVRLPNGFDTWLLTCVARDPRKRFDSAGQAVDALRSLDGSRHERAVSPTLPGPRPLAAPSNDARGTMAGLAPLRAESLHPVSGDGQRELRSPPAVRVAGALLLASGLVWSGYRLGGSGSTTIAPPEGQPDHSGAVRAAEADAGAASSGASIATDGGMTSGDGSEVGAKADTTGAKPQRKNEGENAEAESTGRKNEPAPVAPQPATNDPKPGAPLDEHAGDPVADPERTKATELPDTPVAPRTTKGRANTGSPWNVDDIQSRDGTREE